MYELGNVYLPKALTELDERMQSTWVAGTEKAISSA